MEPTKLSKYNDEGAEPVTTQNEIHTYNSVGKIMVGKWRVFGFP